MRHMRQKANRRQDGGALLLAVAGLVVVAGVTSVSLSLGVEQSERSRDQVNAVRGVMATDSYRRMVLAGYDPARASAWVGQTLYSDMALDGTVRAENEQSTFSGGITDGTRSWGYAFSFSDEIEDVADFDGAEIESVSLPPGCAEVIDPDGSSWFECSWSGRETAGPDYDAWDCWPGNGQGNGRTGCHPTGAYQHGDAEGDGARSSSLCGSDGLVDNWLPKGLRDRNRLVGAWAQGKGMAPEYCANWMQGSGDRSAHVAVTYHGYMRFPENTRFVVTDGADVRFDGPVVFEGDLVIERGDERGGDLTFGDRVLLPNGRLDLAGYLRAADASLAKGGAVQFADTTFVASGVSAPELDAAADGQQGPLGPNHKSAMITYRFLTGCVELLASGARRTDSCQGNVLDLAELADAQTPATVEFSALFLGSGGTEAQDHAALHIVDIQHCEPGNGKGNGKGKGTGNGDTACENPISSALEETIHYLRAELRSGDTLAAIDALDDTATPSASELAAGRYGYGGWKML